MKKKIYVGCALVNVPEEFLAGVTALKDELRRDGFEVLEFAGGNGTVEDVVRKDLGNVEECDLLLAIVTYPSTGLGYELAVAEMNQKPVIAAGKKGVRISRLVQGLRIRNPQFAYVEYESLKDLLGSVKDFFVKNSLHVL